MRHKLLLLILVVAAVLRLWGLSSNPPHLSSDEAALGYNAYSILKTGRDEHGEFLPVVFKSFGDWKPGLYVYLDVPFVALLGLNEFSTRLPGTLSGIIAVWLVYLLAGEIFKEGEKWRRPTQLFASFFLAISPWHLQFTRGAWEAGISLTLTLAGIYFFLRALRDREKYFIFSALCFALTLWAYQGAKSSTAIILVGLVALFYQGLARLSRGTLLKGIVLGIIVSLPVLISVFDGKTGRIKVFSLLSYKQPDEYVQQILQQDKISRDSWQYFLYHSEPLYFVNGVVARWAHHFSGRFLFFEGDWANKRHSVPNNGVLLVLDSLFLISGLVILAHLFPKAQILFRRKQTCLFRQKQTCLFLAFWLLSSPLPAALSRDEIHGVRSLNMVVPLVIIMALGASYFLLKVGKSSKAIKTISFIFVLSYLANFIYYLDGYWVHAPFHNSQAWQYGYKQVVEQVAAVKEQYSEVVVKQDYTQPYIFFLFYQKYDPARYQKASKSSYVNNIYGDVGFISGIDNIAFRNINWSGDRLMSGKLFVVDQEVIANETGLREDIKQRSRFNLIEEIHTLDNKMAFILLGVK